MGRFLVESIRGVPTPTTGPVTPVAGGDQIVTTQLAWDGEQTMHFAYTPCLVLVSARSNTSVTFQFIDTDTGKLARDGSGNAPSFTRSTRDYDTLHPEAASTLPPVGQGNVVSILMLCKENSPQTIKDMIGRSNALGKWPRGEGDEDYRKLLAMILATKGIWKLFSADLRKALARLGFSAEDLP
jgi:hypothetical protein